MKTFQNPKKKTFAEVFFLTKLEAAMLQPATSLKKRIWHKKFPVDLPIFLRTTIL